MRIATVALLALIAGCGGREVERAITEMPAELREEAHAMITKHRRREFIRVLRIPILGVERDVPIVASLMNAQYGFLDVPNNGSVYAMARHKYKIYSYDDQHLLVILRERWVHELQRSAE